MANSSVISTKGQVTVPKRIRTRLGLRVGDRVEFVVQGDHTIIRPVRPAGNPFEKYAGALPTVPVAEGNRRVARRLVVDFLIGAHASLHADRLCTFDPRFYARDFPKLPLIGLEAL